MDELDDVQEERKPFWRCEECGYESHDRPMPANREEFYRKGRPAMCPRCKSGGMMPVGF